jgi:hypothetical protein
MLGLASNSSPSKAACTPVVDGTTIAIELTRRWMEKRQKRILNQNGMQALSPTHGVNIVVGYFTRQQPRDYEFAMHTSIWSRNACPFL